jgi:hypothetical protein
MNEETQQKTSPEDHGTATTQNVLSSADPASVGEPSRFGARRLGSLAVCLAGGILALLIANVPPHVSIKPNGPSMLRPDPGYTWLAPNDSFDWQVRWTPGTHSPTLANVLAATEEGNWQPAPGYAWIDAVTHKETEWVRNVREKEFPHVAAGYQPDTWIIDPGYAPASDWNSITPRVTWKPGIRDYRFPHIESSTEENHWAIDPGYVSSRSALPASHLKSLGRRDSGA